MPSSPVPLLSPFVILNNDLNNYIYLPPSRLLRRAASSSAFAVALWVTPANMPVDTAH